MEKETNYGNLHPDYQQEIVALLQKPTSPKALEEAVSNYHENDIALALTELPQKARVRLYSVADTAFLADIFAYAEDPTPYLDELSVRKKVDILSSMETDQAAAYLKQLDKNQRNMLMELMTDDVRREIALYQSFDEDEIGSVMSTNFIEVRRGLSVREAMRALVDQAAENDNISTLYVVDDSQIFYGAIDLKDLIIAREGDDLEALIATSYPYVYAQEQIEDCVTTIRAYSEDSIPVLDRSNRLLGVITAQDFMQVMDDELGDDYAKLAGLSAEEDLNEPLRESAKKRLPWLLILLGLGLVVSSVVGLFEQVVAQLTVVICFQSLVLDMAGNVGTQSLAVTIRILMDERLTGRQKLALVGKEARVGLLNGLVLGVLSIAVIGLYVWLAMGETLVFGFSVAACVGLALLVSMVLSSVSGTVVPILFKKLGVDPAVASGPLITTINDLVAVVSYYGLSWLLLIQLAQI